MLFENLYACYLYSYPHKTAYRELPQPVPLHSAVGGRERDEAHLYMHIPFCQSRCGYCNLFTTTGSDTARYLHSLRRHARHWHEAGAAEAFRFRSFAIGGGTPLLLSAAQLQELFAVARDYFGVDPAKVPVSVETAPRQTTQEKLSVLQANGVERVSIGIQSFRENELKTLNRNHRPETALTALERLKHAGFPRLNIDLIYGIPGQTRESFLHSLTQALAFAPQEIFLYPLYIRPKTGMEKTGASGRQDPTLTYRLYRAGRDRLLSQGFTQTSMRRFVCCPAAEEATGFSCSEENMISVGCGGRSYIGPLHFSEQYAVEQSACRKILREYMSRRDYREARYGFILPENERKRRHLIKNLLYYRGLDAALYSSFFGTQPHDDFPLLHALQAEGLCTCDGRYWKLTPEGLGYSDAIGPAFISSDVKLLMNRWKES